MELTIETEGFKETRELLRWAVEHWEEIQMFSLQRTAQELADLLDLPERAETFKYLHFVRVARASDDDYYGLSLEPEATLQTLDSAEGYLLHLAAEEEAPARIHKATEGSPFVHDMVPVAPDPGEGFFYLRQANPDELDKIRKLNEEFVADTNATPLDLDVRTPMQMDLAYNTARAEFGLTDERRQAKWRPALRKLIEKRMPVILDEVVEALRTGKLDTKDLPEFEDRSEQWFEDNAEFMMVIWNQ